MVLSSSLNGKQLPPDGKMMENSLSCQHLSQLTNEMIVVSLYLIKLIFIFILLSYPKDVEILDKKCSQSYLQIFFQLAEVKQ